MGDIILGVILILLTLGVFGLYRLFTRKNIEQRSLTKFISILLILGGLFGLLITSLNQRLYDYPYPFTLTILFFITQTIAGVLYYRGAKVGLPILIFTLLLQIPIIHSPNFSYHNQTLLSFNIDNYPGKIWDVEPGSYVHFIYFGTESPNKKFSLGLNLIPLLTIFIYWRKTRQSDKGIT